ncbi:lipase 3-like [Portunus trituberculatus]|uniref:lipase 3-like n=1 Tax=Portunus trituberculatus TaxID=210409 RepID=UPI001E1D1622|nr:lipase 3-like [Portunus trituberculatus]
MKSLEHVNTETDQLTGMGEIYQCCFSWYNLLAAFSPHSSSRSVRPCPQEAVVQYTWLAALLLTVVAPGGGDQPTTAHHYGQPAVKVEHPHARLTTPELVKVHGYPVEVHEVITDDGFIIEIHRIPHGRRHPTVTHSHVYRSHEPHTLYRPSQGYFNAGRATSPLSNYVDDGGPRVTNGSRGGYQWRSRDPKVVLLFPGVFSSSADFVLNEPDQALGFILADGGYDVWLGNYRGNFYARRHKHLTTSDPEFWDHTWNELARYDLPAMLRHVRAVSGAQRVSYIGFSLGTSVFFAMFSYHPEISSWVRSMVALAPVAYIYHMPVPLGLISPFAGFIERVLERADLLELFPLVPERDAPLNAVLCGPNSLTQPLCILNIHFQNGFNQVYLDQEYLPVLLAHYSVCLYKFRAYNYGPERNYREYGQASPPDFSLAKVQVPVALFWSENDALASPLDVAQTASELPQVALNRRINLDYNHLDFMWAEDAGERVYRPALAFLDAFY